MTITWYEKGNRIKPPSYSDLPTEITEHISSFLTPEDKLIARLTCSSWYSLMSTSCSFHQLVLYLVKNGYFNQLKSV